MAVITTRDDTSTNRDLLKIGSLKEIFDNTLKAAPEYWRKVTKAAPADQLILRTQRLGGFVPATEHVEGQNIAIQKPEIGQQKEWTQRFFGTGFRITRVMKQYEKHGLYQQWAKKIAKAQREAKDIEVAVMFNSPTSTSLTCGVGYDTKAIGDTAHTILPSTSSTTYNNYPNASLSQTALETARYYFTTMKNDAGQLMGARADTLIIEPTLFPTASELLKSPYKPYAANETYNVVGNMGLNIFEYPRLTATTRWFLAAMNSDEYDFMTYTGLEPNFIERDAPDRTQDRMVLTDQDFTYGWGDPRMLYVGK